MLGKGSYGTVRLVKVGGGGGGAARYLALKCVPIREAEAANQTGHLVNERAVAIKLDHPLMPKLYANAQDAASAHGPRLLTSRSSSLYFRYATFKDAKYVYLLTDFFPGGELLALHQAAKFTIEEARFYVASIVVMFE